MKLHKYYPFIPILGIYLTLSDKFWKDQPAKDYPLFNTNVFYISSFLQGVSLYVVIVYLIPLIISKFV